MKIDLAIAKCYKICMKEIAIVEKIGALKNEMTHLWTSFFAVGGGSLALLFNNPNIIRGVFGFVGVIFSLLFFNAYFIRRTELLKSIKILEEE